MLSSRFDLLLAEAKKLHNKSQAQLLRDPMAFHPDQWEYDKHNEGELRMDSNELLLRFQAMGTRFEGRAEEIETIQAGDCLLLEREPDNSFNPNNFQIKTTHNRNVGNVPADLCNALAPLFDEKHVVVKSTKAYFVEPLSQRNRHARIPVLFVEVLLRLEEAS